MHLLQSLFFTQRDPIWIIKVILGCIFLLFGILLSIYLIYILLVPYLGDIESGGIVASVLLITGLSLLFFKSEKAEHPRDDKISAIIGDLKEIDISHSLKNYPLAGLLVSLIVGIALSQFKDVKGIMKIFENIKIK